MHWISCATCLYHPLLLQGLLDNIQCLFRAYIWSPFWLANTDVSMCRGLLKNVPHEFVLISPAVPNMSCLSYFDVFFSNGKGCAAAVLSAIASRTYTKQHWVFSCSSHLDFFPIVRVQVVHSYNNTGIDTAWKIFRFILSQRTVNRQPVKSSTHFH